MGELNARQLVALWAILTTALLLRCLGLGWGLPPADPASAASGYRSSYALDEDDVLFAAARLRAGDEGSARSGLQVWLTLAALEAAQAADYFDSGWRDGFLEMRPGDFERTYWVGRLLSAALDLTTVFLVFLLGLRLGGVAAGLWAAALAATAPGLILQACQIRVEPLATLAATAAVLAAVQRRLRPLGLLAGLACAAKLTLAPPMLALAWLAARGRGRRQAVELAALAGLGFALTLPTLGTAVAGPPLGLAADGGRPAMLVGAAVDLARFALGLPVALLAIWRMALWLRERDPAGALVAAAFVVGLVALPASGWGLLRELTPLLPLCAVAAGCSLAAGLGAYGRWAGAAALLVAGLTSLRLVEARISSHPANLALAVLRQAAEPGQSVSLQQPEVPPLDPDRHPPGPNPLLGELRAARPTGS